VPRLLAEIAYQRAVHALGQQEAALNELRSRTGTLLAAEAITTSFLGAAAVQHSALDLSGSSGYHMLCGFPLRRPQHPCCRGEAFGSR
jgi:hypothetical protein